MIIVSEEIWTLFGPQGIVFILFNTDSNLFYLNDSNLHTIMNSSQVDLFLSKGFGIYLQNLYSILFLPVLQTFFLYKHLFEILALNKKIWIINSSVLFLFPNNSILDMPCELFLIWRLDIFDKWTNLLSFCLIIRSNGWTIDIDTR